MNCRRARLTQCFAEGDIVILRQKEDPSFQAILTKPLKNDGKLHTHKGVLNHADIIGKRVRDIIRSSKGVDYRIHDPTLSEYVTLTRRIVTPIYPGDANLIVSLLDLHVTPSTSSSIEEPPLEILEAGTGHGALTLHLARAIHAANVSSVQPGKARLPEQRSAVESENEVESNPTTIKQPEQLRPQRRAVIHTLDIAEKHSNHAKQVVAGFKHGVYAGNVEFYVGDVDDWVNGQLRERKRPSVASESPEKDDAEVDQSAPFLSHVFLDMPRANTQIKSIAPALRADGVLMIFNPSITQIAECVEDVKRLKLPFTMEQVVEMGSGSGVGGREWDVRAVRPRILTRKENAERDAKPEQQDMESRAEVDSASAVACEEEAKEGMKSRDQEQAESLKEQVRSKPEEEQGWTLVSLLHTPPFAADIRHFRDDLAAGRLLPAWRIEAERAGRMRAEGVFEAWRMGEMERVWGVGVRRGGARRAGEEERKKDTKHDERGQLEVETRARGIGGRIVGDGEASRDKKNGESVAAGGVEEGTDKRESTGEVKLEGETAEVGVADKETAQKVVVEREKAEIEVELLDGAASDASWDV
ncbi:hypothetical protein B0A49_11558 [Cryomyces minteri]|uniref:tRNA (adenine(58)-N(1))-methyltransferase catalytic subunit TRM61 n=1 Tax=Cryomyces minteri TaxID=331657 RepID=A0A4U0WFR8_9PEZI|nr:hypothetical protein B0A49_11558 [Cryomyces minteri]